MRSLMRRAVLVALVVGVLGCGGNPVHAAGGDASQSSLNDGYSTFYDFCDQESQFSLLLWIKTTPPNIADYAKRISATAKDDMAILKKFGVEDSALRLDKVSLSPFEIAVRKSMADDRKKQLIWGSTGEGFAQAVRMTQSEVTNYGLHVAQILAASEPNPDRARVMQQICNKWAALHEEAYKLGR